MCNFRGVQDATAYSTNDLLNILESNVLGVIIGAVLALITGFLVSKWEQNKKTQISANLLYFDLTSIENYFESKSNYVNLRYSSNWQEITVDCTFLDEKQIQFIYLIYDSVYNYNYLYDKLNLWDGELDKKAAEIDREMHEKTAEEIKKSLKESKKAIIKAIFDVEEIENIGNTYSKNYTDLKQRLAKEGKIVVSNKGNTQMNAA